MNRPKPVTPLKDDWMKDTCKKLTLVPHMQDPIVPDLEEIRTSWSGWK